MTMPGKGYSLDPKNQFLKPFAEVITCWSSRRFRQKYPGNSKTCGGRGSVGASGGYDGGEAGVSGSRFISGLPLSLPS
jgi:hypothetical protein